MGVRVRKAVDSLFSFVSFACCQQFVVSFLCFFLRATLALGLARFFRCLLGCWVFSWFRLIFRFWFSTFVFYFVSDLVFFSFSDFWIPFCVKLMCAGWFWFGLSISALVSVAFSVAVPASLFFFFLSCAAVPIFSIFFVAFFVYELIFDFFLFLFGPTTVYTR